MDLLGKKLMPHGVASELDGSSGFEMHGEARGMEDAQLAHGHVVGELDVVATPLVVERDVSRMVQAVFEHASGDVAKVTCVIKGAS